MVREVAAVPLGGPLMRVDTGAARTRLEQDRRWVEVSGLRRLPHSVVIEVAPRVAVLVVRSPGGPVDLYDRDGVPSKGVVRAQELPLVSSPVRVPARRASGPPWRLSMPWTAGSAGRHDVALPEAAGT